MVREMMKKQEQLRQETKKTQLTEKTAEALVEKQAQLRKDLNKLNEAIERLPATAPLLEQAKAAAYEATADLFDAKKEEAVSEQSKVLGNLRRLKNSFKMQPTRAARTAAPINSPNRPRICKRPRKTWPRFRLSSSKPKKPPSRMRRPPSRKKSRSPPPWPRSTTTAICRPPSTPGSARPKKPLRKLPRPWPSRPKRHLPRRSRPWITPKRPSNGLPPKHKPPWPTPSDASWP